MQRKGRGGLFFTWFPVLAEWKNPSVVGVMASSAHPDSIDLHLDVIEMGADPAPDYPGDLDALAGAGHTGGGGEVGASSSWTLSAERQITTYCVVAQLNAAMNEKAAQRYRRLDTAAVIVVSLLTVITGSQSLPLLSSPLSGAAPSPGTQGFNIFTGVCGIALGALASMLSRLDWRTKAQTYARRAVGYARLAASVRLQLVLEPRERDGARATLERISAALSLGRPAFIRPTFWEDPFPESPADSLPPESLRRLHFHRLASVPAQPSASESPAKEDIEASINPSRTSPFLRPQTKTERPLPPPAAFAPPLNIHCHYKLDKPTQEHLRKVSVFAIVALVAAGAALAAILLWLLRRALA